MFFAFNHYDKILKITFFFEKRCAIKLNANYMLQSANAKSVQIEFYTVDRSRVLAVKCSKKLPLKLGKMYQTAHQIDGFNAHRLNCIKATLPACAMIPKQQNFTRYDERFNFSTIFAGCQIAQVCVTLKNDQAQ